MPNTNLSTIKAEITKRRKTVSLPKIARETGVSYQTLILLMSGKTQKLSGKVEKRLTDYLSGGKGTEASAPAPKRGRGRPRGSVAAAPKKRGRKPGPAKVKTAAPSIQPGKSLPLMYGKDIPSEIGFLQARINYLKKIEVAQKKYWKLVEKL